MFVPEELARDLIPIGGGVSLIGDSGGSCVSPTMIDEITIIIIIIMIKMLVIIRDKV